MERMTAKQYRKNLQGGQNKMLGESFESLVDTSCKYYEFSGIADITKTPEPMKILRPLEKGQFISVFTKSAQPDYNGVLQGGRAICFDAKFTTQDRINKSVITETQADFLNKKQKLGAVCFVLVGFDTFDYFVIPWIVWRDMEQNFKYKHIKRSELIQPESNRYRVGTTNGGVLDFLATVTKLCQQKPKPVNTGMLRSSGLEVDKTDKTATIEVKHPIKYEKDYRCDLTGTVRRGE